MQRAAQGPDARGDAFLVVRDEHRRGDHDRDVGVRHRLQPVRHQRFVVDGGPRRHRVARRDAPLPEGQRVVDRGEHLVHGDVVVQAAHGPQHGRGRHLPDRAVAVLAQLPGVVTGLEDLPGHPAGELLKDRDRLGTEGRGPALPRVRAVVRGGTGTGTGVLRDEFRGEFRGEPGRPQLHHTLVQARAERVEPPRRGAEHQQAAPAHIHVDQPLEGVHERTPGLLRPVEHLLQRVDQQDVRLADPAVQEPLDGQGVEDRVDAADGVLDAALPQLLGRFVTGQPRPHHRREPGVLEQRERGGEPAVLRHLAEGDPQIGVHHLGVVA